MRERGGDGESGAAPPPPTPRRLPWRFVLTILFTNFAQAVMLTLPFTLATYMVRDWLAASGAAAEQAPVERGPGPPAAASTPTPPTPNPSAPDERRVGELTGALTAAYSLSQAVTSIPLGRWSDRRGRRPVFLVAAASSTLSIAAFGLSGALLPALLARAAGGATNGFIGAWKTMLAEATGGEEGEQARVMALMGLAWGLGCVLGPASGGALARPCSSSSSFFGGAALLPPLLCGEAGLLSARPFALPCLVVAVVCAVSGVMAWFWLPETLGLGPEGLLATTTETTTTATATLPAAAATTAARRRGGGRDEEEEAGGAAAAAEAAAADTSPLLPPPQKQHHQQRRSNDQAAPALRRVVVEAGDGKEEDDGDDAAAAPLPATRHRRPRSSNGTGTRGAGSLELQPTPSFSKFKRLPYDHGAAAAAAADDDDDAEPGDEKEAGGGRRGALLGAGSAEAPPQQQSPPPPPSLAPWRRCPRVRHALAGYGLICLHFIALEELVPLWASAPLSAGGLARQPAQLALPLALNGASLVFFAAVAYPPLRASMGTVALLRLGAALGAAVAALMPLPSLPALLGRKAPAAATGPLPPAALSLWLVLMALKAAAQAAAFTGAMIRVNVVGRRAGSLGSTNGVGQTLASLARGLGPGMAGLSWAGAVWMREGVGVLPAGWPSQLVPFWGVAAIAVGICGWFGRKEAADEEEEEAV